MRETIEKNLNGTNGNYIFPFFWQHGEDEETLRKYMNVIHDAGIGAVCIESRPHPDFVGPKWWADMDAIIDEAKKLGMKVWILDDSHFPTGYTNGAMREKPESLCRRGIVCGAVTVTGGSRKTFDIQKMTKVKKKIGVMEIYQMAQHKGQKRKWSEDVLLSVTAIAADDQARASIGASELDLTDRVLNGKLVWDVPAGTFTVSALNLSYKVGARPDYMNMTIPESCRVLIDTVYETHWNHYKEEFGKTIEGFFSDEPELGNGRMYGREKLGYHQDLPWSPVIEELLEERLGGEYKNLLPYLWDDGYAADKCARIRYIYMDVLTEAVRTAFSEQIGDWCREHGVQYIGHVVEDGGGHARTGGALGHYFRGLWGQDMAGIDDIGGQVYPQGEDDPGNLSKLVTAQGRDGEFYHYELARLAASLAALDPKKQGRAMCEIFGNYGWQEGLRLERYLADHFMVNGINRYVPHAFTAKAFPDPDCPPHFYAHGHNPEYRHFKSLMEYMNRVCGMIDGGVHVAPAAVLYHAESEWTGTCMPDQKVLRELLDAQINADIVPADAFSCREMYRTDLTSGLKVGTQEYKALIIPETRFIGIEVAKGIRELTDQGFPVYFIYQKPSAFYDSEEKVDGYLDGCRAVGLKALTGILYQNGLGEIRISPADNRVRYLHYCKDGEDLYYFVNEGTDTWNGEIEVPTTGHAYSYNAWDNRLESVGYRSTDEGTILTAALEPLQSLLVVFGEQPEGALAEPLAEVCKAGTKQTFGRPWTRSTCRSLEYPNFTGAKEISLPDDVSKEDDTFSGWIRYENSFTADGEGQYVLVVTDAYEGVEVFVNGESAGVQVTPVYRFDITSLVKAGENTIAIEVSTTLEHERRYAKDRSMMERIGCRPVMDPTGITGRIYLIRK